MVITPLRLPDDVPVPSVANVAIGTRPVLRCLQGAGIERTDPVAGKTIEAQRNLSTGVDPAYGTATNSIIHHELIIDVGDGLKHDPRRGAAHVAGRRRRGELIPLRQRASGQGSNSIQVRQFNERVILALLRRLGTASKADLARHANLTANTAGMIVHDLEAAGLIRSEGKRQGDRGQPATLLGLDPAGAYSLGVKIGRRSLDTILVDFSRPGAGASGAANALPAARTGAGAGARGHCGLARDDFRHDQAARTRRSRRRHTLQHGQLAARARHPVRVLPGLERFRHRRPACCRDRPATLVENDGTAAVVAELFGGHGRELNDFLYVFIGSATGGGVVIGGDYHRGAHGNAGDIGLMPVPASRLADGAIPEPALRYPADARLDQRPGPAPARLGCSFVDPGRAGCRDRGPRRPGR